MKNKIKPVLAIIMVCSVLAACKFSSSEKDVAQDTTAAPIDTTTVTLSQDSAAQADTSAAVSQ